MESQALSTDGYYITNNNIKNKNKNNNLVAHKWNLKGLLIFTPAWKATFWNYLIFGWEFLAAI